jgi:uncharacterized RDD family membrane protein YckC
MTPEPDEPADREDEEPGPEDEGAEGPSWPLASIGARAAARTIDTVLLLAILLAIGLLLVDPDDDSANLPVFLLSLAASALYEVAFLVWRGQTPGKIALKLRVVDHRTEGLPDVWAAFRRWVVPGGIVPAVFPRLPFVGSAVIYLSAMLSPERRGWHDKLAGTKVVSLPS